MIGEEKMLAGEEIDNKEDKVDDEENGDYLADMFDQVV